jgi:hypothetical protein
MGCGASSEAAPPVGLDPQASAKKAENNPQEMAKSTGIDRELDRARQQEELKVKLLLLGAGESGKSTIFKQMRILHGSPRTDDDQKMYGVIVRQNVITAMRKLCPLLRSLNLETQLANEEKPANAELSPKEAYDLIMSHLVENTGDASTLPKPTSEDWVGESARAGLSANNDAKLFLGLWKHIKTLWEVCCATVYQLASWPFCNRTIQKLNIVCSLLFFTVQVNEGSLVKASSCKRYRWSQRLSKRPNTDRIASLQTDDTGRTISTCQDDSSGHGAISN